MKTLTLYCDQLLTRKPSMKDIKDKPDSLKAFLKYRRMNWPHEWVEDHGAINYAEFKKFWIDYYLPALKRIEELEKQVKNPQN